MFQQILQERLIGVRNKMKKIIHYIIDFKTQEVISCTEIYTTSIKDYLKKSYHKDSCNVLAYNHKLKIGVAFRRAGEIMHWRRSEKGISIEKYLYLLDKYEYPEIYKLLLYYIVLHVPTEGTTIRR